MPVWDNIIVGQPKIAPSNFGAGFYDDFARLDIGRLTAPGARDGKWKRGFYASNITQWGATWGSDSAYGPAQINRERQMYADPKYAHKYGWSGLRIDQNGLVLSSRPVDHRWAFEADYARVKGYPLNADGSDGAFVNDLQVPWLGEMLSTYGRFSASFFEVEARIRIPYGAVQHPSDINQRKTVFPAFWLLQDIPYGRGIDGEPISGGQTTYMPAKFGLGGVMSEIDIWEGFGYETSASHQTLHYHVEGNATTQSVPHTITTDTDIMKTWAVAGCHVTPGKIGCYINGVYTAVWDTPDEIALGMRVPTYTDPWQATGFDAAFQTHDGSGDRRYMQWCVIMNIARDAKLTRDYAQLVYDGGYGMPQHPDTARMHVDYVHVKPLIVDNPDAYGMTVRGQYVPTGSGGWDAYQ